MRYIYSIIVSLCITVSGFAQSYGLTFNSHEVVLEKRTSLDISPDDSICLGKNFELNFDIRFAQLRQIYFGYVLRIISGSNQNIDLLYNQPSSAFKVIIGENFSGISFMVDSLKLYADWCHFSIKCDLDRHSLEFSVNGRPIGHSAIPPMGNCFKFLWGANDHLKFKTRDIPPMRIRDIRLSDEGVLKYFWPLDESSGDSTYDKVGHRMARIKNPVWAKPKYQKWELVSSLTLGGYGAVTYDPKHDKVYIIGADSVGACSIRTDQPAIDWTASRHQELNLGHQAVYDTISDRLYDVFVDKRICTAFDFTHGQWDLAIQHAPITEFWHANMFISPADSALYLVGGYGQLKYKNLVQRYRFSTRKWDTVKTSGDYFPPRYLAGSAMDPKGAEAYIIGGYGSQTGDQMLDPRNYYDLFRYDIKKASFKRIYTLRAQAAPFTFGNSLVIGAKPDAWYGLTFPNDSYNSNLQLVEGSLTDSAYRPEGDLIPFSFHDVQSYADLYYSPRANKLIAVTLLYSGGEDTRDKKMQVKIYTLDFPPGAADSVQAGQAGMRRRDLPLLALALMFAAGVAIFFLVRKRGARHRLPLTDLAHEDPSGAGEPGHVYGDAHLPGAIHMPMPNENAIYPAIFLFGPFQVFDKQAHDITRQFTPLLKELFLVIITYTFRNGRGISSESLNELLWHDKSEKDAKNNRSVNLAKLKVILEKVGNVIINKESGNWQFQIPEEDVYVDYKKYILLLQSTAAHDKTYIHALVDIIRRGAFLSQTEYNWLDDVKSEISNATIDRCLEYIKGHQFQDPEFIIEIANCIFCFDPLNEDALNYKCKCLILLKRHTLANNTYLKFIKEYKEIYGTDFGKSFQEVIA